MSYTSESMVTSADQDGKLMETFSHQVGSTLNLSDIDLVEWCSSITQNLAEIGITNVANVLSEIINLNERFEELGLPKGCKLGGS